MNEDQLRQRFPNASEQFIRANAGPLSMTFPIMRDAPKNAHKRIRQSAKPVMNALETRFYQKLCTEYPVAGILPQAVRIELARGIWFKPDFFIPSARTFFEVKGPHAFRGGFENLKVAARVHCWAKFFLVREDDAKAWQRQEILA